MYKKLFSLVLVFSVSHTIIFAQYNFNAGFPVVYNILNTQCSNAGCHSATASVQSLRFDTTAAAVYAQIVGQPPVNSAALARGEQLVWIDQPYQSYLLKKAGSWFDTDLALPAGEPDSAAHAGAGLSNNQVEYIRQWILNAASESTDNIDTSIINDYYNVSGVDTGSPIAFFPHLAQPSSGNGIQVRYGPIFLRNTPGNNEVEYMLVHQINFPYNTEVTGVESSMSSMSHHFLLFQFPDSSSAAPYEIGLRRVILGANTVTPFDPPTKNIIAAWQTPSNIVLPTGTALFWAQQTYIDQDYHVKNYTPIIPGTSGIVPFDFFLNITYRQRVVTDGVIQMKSNLVNNPAIVLLPHQYTTLPYSDQDNGNNEMRYIWMLSSHTHKFGVGFNIYKYDNSQPGGYGDTLYKGTYSYADGVDLGYYDWEHPSVEYFAQQYPMNMATNGLICQATWDNDSSNVVTFGFTTANEMELFYYMYTSVLPTATTGVQNISKSAFDFVVYPNPMSNDMGTIAYTLTDAATVNASILDITGKEIAVLSDEKEPAGSYNVDMGQQKSLSPGMYFARVTVNGESYTKKFVIE